MLLRVSGASQRRGALRCVDDPFIDWDGGATYFRFLFSQALTGIDTRVSHSTHVHVRNAALSSTTFRSASQTGQLIGTGGWLGGTYCTL